MEYCTVFKKAKTQVAADAAVIPMTSVKERIQQQGKELIDTE